MSDYLRGYAPDTVERVLALRREGRLQGWLLQRHPQGHDLRSDKALFDYLQALRQQFLRSAAPLSKAHYDSKLQLLQQALGTHTQISRVQGGALKAKREIRIAAVFRDAPLAFLRMIAVHELAHLREREHNRAFYQLCCHMEPDYHQLEFEVRIYLCHLEAGGARLWSAP